MRINCSGWSEKYGSYKCDVFIDVSRSDYEVRFESGRVLRQSEPFQCVTADWNCDGDVYTEFGATFVRYDKDGTKMSGGEFWTPNDLVYELVDGLYGDGFGVNDRVVSISGITVPSLNAQPSLREQISRSEKQQMLRDIERNKKMASLGIREAGEPWAK